MQHNGSRMERKDVNEVLQFNRSDLTVYSGTIRAIGATNSLYLSNTKNLQAGLAVKNEIFPQPPILKATKRAH